MSLFNTKHSNKIIVSLVTTLFLLLSTSFSFAQTSYTMTLENGTYIDSKTIEFEIYLSTTESNLELVSYQCILKFNSEIENGGSLGFSYVTSTSELTNTPIGVCDNTFDGDEELSVGSNVGSDIISNTKVKIGKFRISNTVSFSNVPLDLVWDFNGMNYTALFSTSFSNITNQQNHMNLEEPSPLPVELSTFKAVAGEKSINLQWETKTEVNNYGFEIERASEDKNWEKIGFIEGSGNSNTSNKYSYTDKNIFGSDKFYYRLKQVDFNGSATYSDEILSNISVKSYELFQNYPNPFNPATTITFSIVAKNKVSLIVYNILGQKVAELINKEMEAGIHKFDFNSKGLASGTYIYRLNVENQFTSTKKMVLLK